MRTGAPRQRSRLRLSDALGEASAAITARWARSALTMLGVAIGVGTFLSIIGLTSTAQAQVNAHFDALAATTVTASDRRPPLHSTEPLFTDEAASRISAIEGVTHVSALWQVNLNGATVTGSPLITDRDTAPVDVLAASPTLPDVIGASLSTGRFYDVGHADRADRVVVLGVGAARQLGITTLATQPAVLIGTRTYQVIGILDDAERRSDLLTAAIIPTTTASLDFGPPGGTASEASFLVVTRVGATDVVASQIGLAADPAHADWLAVTAGYTAVGLQTQVTTDLNTLLYALAGICLVIGAIGIANTTLVAVMERTREIGLRRALGALRRHIAAQIMIESAALGLLGGLFGMLASQVLVITIAALKHWTPLLSPTVMASAPLAGLLVGTVAGLYPALRATTIEPTEALRR